MLRTVIEDSPDWPERVGASWRDLAESDPAATPFQTLEWQSTWFRHFGRGKRARICGVFEGEDLVGLMPFVRVWSPWRALRPMGCGPSDYLQPITRPGYETEVAERIADFLVGEARRRLVDVHQVRETLPLALALAEAASAAPEYVQATCLVLDLPRSYDEYLTTLGKSLRYDVKRLDKEPFSTGGARIVAIEPGQTEEGVDFFFEAHKKRWSKRDLPGAFMIRKVRDFHQEWAAIAAQKGWLRMSVLEWEGQRIGAIYAMRFGDACYFYQSGFDPAKSTVSPGSLLVAHTIRRSIEEGLTRFDFLRGDEPYKRRWKPHHVYRNLRFMLGEASLLPQLGKGWNKASFRVETRLRERFEGKGLRG